MNVKEKIMGFLFLAIVLFVFSNPFPIEDEKSKEIANGVINLTKEILSK